MKQRLLSLGATLLTAGCLGGPHSQTYVMSAAATGVEIASNDPETAVLEGAVLQVEVVGLSAYLDNTAILLRRGAHRLESAPLGHWGERLSLGITHALAADLAAKLPQVRVVLQRPQTPAARLLRVNINGFDVFPDGRCVLVADWAIVEKSRASPPILGAKTFVTPALAQGAPDVAALVGAMSAAVGALADGVAATL